MKSSYACLDILAFQFWPV